MENESLLKELEEKFNQLKKEFGFKSSLDDIDLIFFIRDYVLGQRFVSQALSRQICSRIVDTYAIWNNYLHTLIMPQPYSLFHNLESGLFDDAEKKEISTLIKKSMALITTNSIVGLTKDKKLESWFIDEAVNFWKKEFSPALIKIIKKINLGWKESKDK